MRQPPSNTLTHTQTHLKLSILTYLVNLHCQCFVMMSPSLPLKVDAGGLSPQPDTPDTPVPPYLSSPDEVTTTWRWWVWLVAWTQTPIFIFHPKHPPLWLVRFDKFPLPLPAESMTSSSLFTSHYSTDTEALPRLRSAPTTSAKLYESAPQWKQTSSNDHYTSHIID